ncbi:MAG: hypothetical protein HKO09_01200 [Croceitalea sp.]|nr:hypothetical protein [Croceitalea sp.]
MKSTAHSEYLPITSLFIKPVDAAFVSQGKIEKEWKRLHYLSAPDYGLAKKEYEAFEALLTNRIAQLHHFPKDDSLSLDAMYCRDASIATDFGMIICNMGKRARSKEPKVQERVFKTMGIKILGSIEAPGTLEGGDVAWLDHKTLAVGHTYRTNEAGIQQLKRLLEPFDLEILVVDLPHYKGPTDVFHLMSILSPVDKNLAVVYSPLMPIAFRKELIYRGFELVEVPDEEFESMGCNVLALAPKVCVMVAGNPKTVALLRAAGCEVLVYEGNQISVMGGGGPTCLTRPLQRQM